MLFSRIFTKSSKSAFSLIELLVVVVIVVSLSAAAYISLSPRMSVTRVESYAITLAEFLETARAQALLKRCPTRVVLCTTRECPVGELASGTSSDDGGHMSNAGDDPVGFVAILRLAQYGDAYSGDDNASCLVPLASGDTPPNDGYTQWDFEIRPQNISQEIRLSNIYGGAWDDTDWSDITSSAAEDSVWFPRSLTVTVGLNELRVPANIPISATADRVNEAENLFIFFQVKEAGCDPSSDEDCIAYFVGLNESGEGVIQPCISDSDRSTTKDACF